MPRVTSNKEKTMNKTIKKHIENLASTDDKIRLEALQSLLKVTNPTLTGYMRPGTSCSKNWTMRIPTRDRSASCCYAIWQKAM